MQERNIDLDLPVTAEQWNMIVQTAEARGRVLGFRVEDGDPPGIVVLASLERAPTGWAQWLSPRSMYGEAEKEAARLVFNAGNPYAALEPWATPEEELEEAELQARAHAFQRWVRDRWHELMQESGLRYVRGRVPAE